MKAAVVVAGGGAGVMGLASQLLGMNTSVSYLSVSFKVAPSKIA